MTLNIWFLFNLFKNLLFRTPLKLTGKSFVRIGVLPWDLDLNFHMNNGRFLTYMDIGRGDFILRTGFTRLMLRKRWQPVAGSIHIVFRRSMELFRMYNLHTRILCHDDKWIYFEQIFERHGKVHSTAIVKVTLLEKGKSVPPVEIMEFFGTEETKNIPRAPDYIENRLAAEKVLLERANQLFEGDSD